MRTSPSVQRADRALVCRSLRLAKRVIRPTLHDVRASYTSTTSYTRLVWGRNLYEARTQIVRGSYTRLVLGMLVYEARIRAS